MYIGQDLRGNVDFVDDVLYVSSMSPGEERREEQHREDVKDLKTHNLYIGLGGPKMTICGRSLKGCYADPYNTPTRRGC